MVGIRLTRLVQRGSSSTSQGSSVTVICSGATDTFDGRSNTTYKRWLQAIQTTATKHDLAAFVQGITPSMTRTLPTDTLLSNKSQPFSIVWTDNTDSICDLQCLLTYVDNYVNNRHNKGDSTRSSTTNGITCRTSNGVAASSSLPCPSSLP
jgi:hypothetical protein